MAVPPPPTCTLLPILAPPTCGSPDAARPSAALGSAAPPQVAPSEGAGGLAWATARRRRAVKGVWCLCSSGLHQKRSQMVTFKQIEYDGGVI